VAPNKNIKQDSFGLFANIPFDKTILDKLKSLELMPLGSSISVDVDDYLNALYPEEYFPGGWKKVVGDAQLVRRDVLPPMAHLLKGGTKLNIFSADLRGKYYGLFYQNKLSIDFRLIRAKKTNPINTIVHELGHWINDGPNESRINAETEALIAKRRGREIGPSFAVGTPKNIYQEISDLGIVVAKLLKKQMEPKDYDILMNLSYGSGGNKVFAYCLAREEAQQRYYRPIKFWYASLAKKYGDVIGLSPNSAQNNLSNVDYLMKLLSHATSQDYDDLFNNLSQINKSGKVLNGWVLSVLKQALRDKSIYPDMISTVKSNRPQAKSIA